MTGEGVVVDNFQGGGAFRLGKKYRDVDVSIVDK